MLFSAATDPTVKPGPLTDPPAAPELRAPDDRFSGPLINPSFRCTGVDNDRLRLQHKDRDSTSTNLVDITKDTVTSYVGEDGELLDRPETYDTGDVADFSTSQDGTTVRLLDGLQPGSYTWSVQRTAEVGVDGEDTKTVYAPSAERTFTVLGPALRKLSVSASSRKGSTSSFPGYTNITVATNAYTHVQFTVAHNGRSRVEASDATRSGRAGISVTWSCRSAGGTYRVTIRASDQFGATRARVVSFKPASKSGARRCGAPKLARGGSPHRDARPRSAPPTVASLAIRPSANAKPAKSSSGALTASSATAELSTARHD